MNIQLAYRVTGEKIESLHIMLKKIKAILESNNHNLWIPELDPKKPSVKKELLNKTLNKIMDCDAILAIVKSEEKSEGMLLEIGYAIGKNKKVFLLIKENIKNTYLLEVSNKIITFKDEKDLYEKVKLI